MERPELLAEARRAFARGRRRTAARAALVALPLAALSLAWNRTSPVGAALAALLVAASAALAWRGGVGARAVRPGLLAGLPPMLGPLVTDVTCAACGSSLARYCVASCVLGGLAGGALLWRYASRLERGRAEFVLAAGTIASIAGTLGCVFLGFTGVLAMIAALAVLSAPAALVPVRSA